ncbi:Major facilitator superfamily domain general substrate transporter [Penicillium frequentans]|uniref:Major facilitator superfamily domain general substrate transporter n=1 Tax=Penicillium frequentans TaxID=3151616 RepID=A0AAD6D501_9EURO|nr:Major facilitator superfamily domain general substrate transporter [Penicillium glabrum]
MSTPGKDKTSLSPDTHPHSHIPDWKWKGTLAVLVLTTLINGYDVSSLAKIQPALYRSFGNITLLSWISLSFSLAVVMIFMAGAAVAGAASNLPTVIVGKSLLVNLTFVAVFATPDETPCLFRFLSAVWATGLVIGGLIGSALASNKHTTWRRLVIRLMAINPVGIGCNMATPVLFAMALEFFGPVWDWGSSASIALWVVFGVALVGWIVQQYWCIGTTSEQRAIPVHLLSLADLPLLRIASGCAGASYAITLYYTPLFFAFAHGHSTMQQTVRLLPFALVFIAVVVLVGGLLPVLGRYNLIYIVAGIATVAGTRAMAGTLSPSVSESQILGLEALIGVGLG